MLCGKYFGTNYIMYAKPLQIKVNAILNNLILILSNKNLSNKKG